MEKEKIRFCNHCDGIIPDSRNGNSKFCSESCYLGNKTIVMAEANKIRAKQRILLKNDEILEELFYVYESKYYISAKILINRNFDWDIHSGETLIDNLNAKKLIRYGYTLFINQTVQLWKL